MPLSVSKSFFCFLLIFLPLIILSHGAAQATTGDPSHPECTGDACSRPEAAGGMRDHFYPHTTAAPCGCQHPLYPGIPCGPQGFYPKPCKEEAGKPAGGQGCRPGGSYQQCMACGSGAQGMYGGYPGNLPGWMVPPNMYQQYLSGMQAPFGMGQGQQCYNSYTGRYEPCSYQNAPYGYPEGSGGGVY